jgi:nucleoside-diphosphate-sugar epimerase
MGREHVIPQFALRMAELVNGKPAVRFRIQGTGDETRAFLYIDDFIDGLLRVLDHGEHLGIYHIGSEEEVPLRRLAEEVGRVFGRRVEIVPGPLQEGSTPRRCPDTRKLRALGFAPRVPLREGLKRTVKWYVET